MRSIKWADLPGHAMAMAADPRQRLHFRRLGHSYALSIFGLTAWPRFNCEAR
jgi:hypothetical protein